MLQMVAICPHPPIIIPEIGKGEERKAEKTVKAMERIAQDIKSLEPDLIVFITPHGPVFQDAITISRPKNLKGSFSKFGSFVSLKRSFASSLSSELVNKARGIKGMVAELTDADSHGYGITLEMDHGILVPLYYLDKAGVDKPILPINMGLLSYPDLYEFGICLKEVIDNTEAKVVVVVSADLSHRLTKEAPAGFEPLGKVFDETLVQAISEGDVIRVLNINEDLINKAGECGLRPIIMGLGTLDGNEINSKVYSYEGPYGVGYLVASLIPGEEITSRCLLGKIRHNEKERIEEVRSKESWPVKWARENLENYIMRGKLLNLPETLPTEFSGQKGAFVSIKKNGQLRGCIGTISATKGNIAEEIQANALKAAFEDPRFESIKKEELAYLTYSVDILEKPEKISGLEDLNPEIYGVIVRKGPKQGLLLPMLEGIDTAKEQVAIAKQKAGIGSGEDIKLERFRVRRFL